MMAIANRACRRNLAADPIVLPTCSIALADALAPLPDDTGYAEPHMRPHGGIAADARHILWRNR